MYERNTERRKVRGRRKRENFVPEGIEGRRAKGCFFRKPSRFEAVKEKACLCVYVSIYVSVSVCVCQLSIHEKRQEYFLKYGESRNVDKQGKENCRLRACRSERSDRYHYDKK